MTAPPAPTLAPMEDDVRPIETPIDQLYESVGNWAWEHPSTQSALTVVRRLVEAAGHAADFDSVENHRALKDAWAKYRAWSPDTGGGSGEGAP